MSAFVASSAAGGSHSGSNEVGKRGAGKLGKAPRVEASDETAGEAKGKAKTGAEGKA
jgi:hypothetical protein